MIKLVLKSVRRVHGICDVMGQFHFLIDFRVVAYHVLAVPQFRHGSHIRHHGGERGGGRLCAFAEKLCGDEFLRTEYTANNLNQYTAVGDFTPSYDADGNQTLVKTSTGIWSVEYNAENRPIRFTSSDGSTVIECAYDYMGRRATKKVTENGSITLHHRYLYRGYLQIACCDLTRSAHPCLWLLTWDPTQPVATRPLAIRKDGSRFAYGWDLTKNICEVFGQAGYIRTSYTYSPYGTVSEVCDVTQPIQWSSEFFDTDRSEENISLDSAGERY